MVINCLKLRDQIASEIKSKVDKLKSREITPSLAIIQIGDNPNSNAYIRVKTKKAEEMGIQTKLFKFENPKTLKSKTEKQIEELIVKLNMDTSIHGIIIQRPLPVYLDENKLQSSINPKKDIDGLSKNSPFKNPLVSAVEHVIHYVFSQSNFPLPSADRKLQTVVVGKGITAGAPIYRYFANHPNLPDFPDLHFNVSQIDSSTKNPDEILKSADIIISCVGKERIIRPDNIKKGVILISVGQHIRKNPLEIRKNPSDTKINKWSGDYNENEIENIAQAYTPTPNGIGPLNVIFLLQNVINAIE